MNFYVLYIMKKMTKAKLEEAIRKAGEWEIGLEKTYTEDEICDIMSILSYHENIESGFGHRNNENHYADIFRYDLYEEAMRGLEWMKECKRCSSKI